MKLSKTPYFSYKAGELASGCKMCVRGEKLVLFVTGLCSARCEFCPVSDAKLYKDVIYANEREVGGVRQVIEEARVSRAKGAGITGGDPLVKIDRTALMIKALKKEFGRKFHIHLYAPLRLVTADRLEKLAQAGLDEIRFHPHLETPKDWPKIGLARSHPWTVGVEIPAIPGTKDKTLELIRSLKGKIDFLNINELELADNKVWRGIHAECKDDISYAIKGSEELALELARYAARQGMRVHYCTCKLKDAVQLSKRIKRRAQKAKKSYDRVTEEGILVRGAVYLPDLAPGFGYRAKLSRLSEGEKSKAIKRLVSIRKRVPGLELDKHKVRLLGSCELVESMPSSEAYKRAIVAEYPTYDLLELEVEMLEVQDGDNNRHQKRQS